MQTRTNIAMTSLAVLWIMTGLFFGGLGSLGHAPMQPAAPWAICGIQPPAWANACVSRTQEHARARLAQAD